ncbi:MAG: TIGR02302 family protein [Pseudomonadota bacterium]
MTVAPSPITPVLKRLRRQITLTRFGLLAERLARAFWPVWSLSIAICAALMLGLHDLVSMEVVWFVGVCSILGLFVFLWRGATRFRWPRRQEAIERLDSVLAGRPLAALADHQAIGEADSGSRALWQAHLKRMEARTDGARAVEPDLRLSGRDPFGLRYVALLGLVLGLLFGSVWRAGSMAQMVPGSGAALASGPTWEGWIEPPGYSGLPSLYLADQNETVSVPEGSTVTLRLYGEVESLTVAETVSGRTEDIGAASDSEQSFEIVQDGAIQIDGAGGRQWQITAIGDRPPEVALLQDGFDITFDGQMSQPFGARDDYGVSGGTAVFALDLPSVDRRHGLSVDPDPREPIVLDLPMPITGNRDEFEEMLIENLSEHPWAHLPVSLTLEVQDARDQIGRSVPSVMPLPARRFFDPLAAAVIEQRRDLLWAKSNATRVGQMLRAVSYAPEPGLFRSESSYLRMRVILRRLEAATGDTPISDEDQAEIAEALWDLAVLLEDGDIEDALERMRAAQDRLSEAMRNGASEDEIARLMQELRDATQDYLRQRSQQAQRDGEGAEQSGEMPENMQSLNQQDLQDMMDRIQELMEQGRFAEAQQALEEFQQMMENMQVARGQGQGQQSPGQQAMEGLAETLRDQQGLSDEAFRDFQEQYNPGAQSGQSKSNQGRDGAEGQGQSHQQGQGNPGQNEGSQGGGDGRQSTQDGQGGVGQPNGGQPNDLAGSLADRQQALRQELQRQQQGLPNVGGEAGEAARDALDRAGRAMDGAEQALRGDDLPEAIDRQAEAMDALRDGMRSLGEALAENNQGQAGQGQAQSNALGQFGEQDPLGRSNQGLSGDRGDFEAREDVYRRAGELLDEIRRRSGETERPDLERDYLNRLLDRF